MAPPSKRLSYRPEIQGIRTIGALLVATFHIWFGRVSGGVDVFFVISGFLITGSLYKELQKSQSINVLAFWGRIAKRVAPMAYTILALTLLAAWLWMPKTDQVGLLAEVLYSAFHLENIKLMMNSVDYLAREEAPSPVQQFWALSVQVQFYAVWPFLLLATAFVARRMRSGAAPFVAVLAAVFLASLTYSVIATGQDADPAYFNTLARVWEFALGGLMAVVLPGLSIPPKIRFAAGWIGLVAVISCGFALPDTAAFPGYVALWPTVGAALVLVSGGGGLRFGADRLLASKPLVALGELSFSFYLWHWLVLIFAMILTGRTQLNLLQGLTVIAIALCGAYCTSRWVEAPLQRSSIGKRKAWHVHALAAGLEAPVVMIAAAWGMVLDQKGDGQGPPAAASAFKQDLNRPLEARSDKPRAYRDKCTQTRTGEELIVCTYGADQNPIKTLAVVGNSHSTQWLPALEILAQQYRWRIVLMTKDDCPFSTNERLPASCKQWRKELMGRVLELKPDAVLTTASRPSQRPLKEASASVGVPGKSMEYVPAGYVDQWSRITEQGLTVIALRDTPWMGLFVPKCLAGAPSIGINCGRLRKEVLDDVDPTTTLQKKPAGVAFVDMNDRFCDESICPPIRNDIIIYRDKHHITATYARSLAPVLGERMRKVRPDLFIESSGF
jgi:peptidoglycan/LPS O-acetylase OafA/YrhL